MFVNFVSGIVILLGFFLVLISLPLLLSYSRDLNEYQNNSTKFLGFLTVRKQSSSSSTPLTIGIDNIGHISIPEKSHRLIIILLVGFALIATPFFTIFKENNKNNQSAQIKKIEDHISNIYESLDQIYIEELIYTLEPKPPYRLQFFANKKNRVLLSINTWSQFADSKFRVTINNQPFKISKYPGGELPLSNFDGLNLDITQYLEDNINHNEFYHEIKIELANSLSYFFDQINPSTKSDECIKDEFKKEECKRILAIINLSLDIKENSK